MNGYQPYPAAQNHKRQNAFDQAVKAAARQRALGTVYAPPLITTTY